MFLRFESKLARGAPAAHFDIVAFVRALRHIARRQVRDGGEQAGQFLAKLAILIFQRGHGLLDLGDFGLERLRLVGVALTHCLPDGLGGFIAAALHLLQPCGERAPLLIHRQDFGGNRLQPAPCQRGIESFGIFADRTDVMHGRAYAFSRASLSSAEHNCAHSASN